MATMPGLPMLGHGQVEGFGEKYGMEFRRATLDEHADPWLVERHEREIFPLLHRRAWFAEASDFLLYDLVTDGGRRRRAGLRLLERQRADAVAGRCSTTGSARRPGRSATPRPYARRSGERRASGSSDARSPTASGCRTTPAISWPSATRAPGSSTSARAGRSASAACGSRSNAYEGHVFWEFREVHDGCRGPVARLAAPLGGRGVPVARRRDARAPARTGPRAAAGDLRRRPRARRCSPRGPRPTRTSTRSRRGSRRSSPAIADGDRRARRRGDRGGRSVRERTDRGLQRRRGRRLSRRDRAALLGWLALSRTGELAPGADVAATSAAWFDELRLAPRRSPAGFRTAGLDEGEAWAAADRVRVLLRLPRPSSIRRAGGRADAAPARGLAGARRRPRRDRRQHLGGRRVARPRPLRGHARLGRRVWTRSRAGTPADPGLVRASARRPPRQPVIGSMRCRAGARRTRARGRPSNVRRAPKPTAGSSRSRQKPVEGPTPGRLDGLPEQDPPEQRRRRRPVGDHRFRGGRDRRSPASRRDRPAAPPGTVPDRRGRPPARRRTSSSIAHISIEPAEVGRQLRR